MAVLFLVIARFSPGSVYGIFHQCLFLAAYINIALAVFNLFPIPPLDGSRILQLLIPDKYYFKFAQYERYIVIVVILLIIVGVLDKPLTFLRDGLLNILEYVIGLPFPKG